MNSLVNQVLRPGLLLGLFTIVATSLLALTYERTRAPIAAAEQAAQLRILNTLVPADTHDNDLLQDTVRLAPDPLLGSVVPGIAYRARRDGRVETVVLPLLASDGYSGDIFLLLAVHRDGSVAGVRVTSHRETPGLGDAIEAERSSWILGFNGRSLNDPPLERWKVRKDGGVFDQLTGATISPRAVVHAVRDGLHYFAQHREQLLGGPGRPPDSGYP